MVLFFDLDFSVDPLSPPEIFLLTPMDIPYNVLLFYYCLRMFLAKINA